ncbi:hypothetical protein Tco_1140134 [Tanacetum coccineum]
MDDLDDEEEEVREVRSVGQDIAKKKVLEKIMEDAHMTWTRFGEETKKKDKNQDRDRHHNAFSECTQNVQK